ncbi:MAG: SMI1/KNR4 family protein [Pseudomonadota bacterium]
MSKSLTDLIAILALKRPELVDALNPPASDEDIASLEHTLGVSLPSDFVSALKVGNGQKGSQPGIFDEHAFYSCVEIASDWRVWKKLLDGGDFDDERSSPSAGIRPDWWNPGWIPFTSNGSGDCFCLDMVPTPEGRIGQIIFVWHDMADRQNVSDSFSAWISALCAAQGDYQ